MNKERVQAELCRQLCADITLIERADGVCMISVPFSYPDGDHYSIYIEETKTGHFRLSDKADTMMRLSYDTPDVDKYFQGSRGKLMKQILSEHNVQENDGNFYVDISADKIADGLFRLQQVMSQVYDLSYLNKDRVKSVFYEELHASLQDIASRNELQLNTDYIVPNIPRGDDYSIDFVLRRKGRSVFAFGVSGPDKAKLVAIKLHFLSSKKIQNPTLLILDNAIYISKTNLNRLQDANVRGSQIDSLAGQKALNDEVLQHLEAA